MGHKLSRLIVAIAIILTLFLSGCGTSNREAYDFVKDIPQVNKLRLRHDTWILQGDILPAIKTTEINESLKGQCSLENKDYYVARFLTKSYAPAQTLYIDKDTKEVVCSNQETP